MVSTCSFKILNVAHHQFYTTFTQNMIVATFFCRKQRRNQMINRMQRSQRKMWKMRKKLNRACRYLICERLKGKFYFYLFRLDFLLSFNWCQMTRSKRTYSIFQVIASIKRLKCTFAPPNAIKLASQQNCQMLSNGQLIGFTARALMNLIWGMCEMCCGAWDTTKLPMQPATGIYYGHTTIRFEHSTRNCIIWGHIRKLTIFQVVVFLQIK